MILPYKHETFPFHVSGPFYMFSWLNLPLVVGNLHYPDKLYPMKKKSADSSFTISGREIREINSLYDQKEKWAISILLYYHSLCTIILGLVAALFFAFVGWLGDCQYDCYFFVISLPTFVKRNSTIKTRYSQLIMLLVCHQTCR